MKFFPHQIGQKAIFKLQLKMIPSIQNFENLDRNLPHLIPLKPQ